VVVDARGKYVLLLGLVAGYCVGWDWVARGSWRCLSGLLEPICQVAPGVVVMILVRVVVWLIRLRGIVVVRMGRQIRASAGCGDGCCWLLWR